MQPILEDLLVSFDLAVWVTTGDGSDVLYASPALSAIYGRPFEDFLSDPSLWLDTVHPEDRAEIRRQSDALPRRDTLDLTYRIVRPGGDVRWVRDRKRVVRDDEGRPLRYEGVVTDITAQREAEAALQRREASLRSFYDSSPLLMGVVELHGDDVLHRSDNAATAAFFGTTPEALRDRLASELGVDDAYRARWAAAYRTAAQEQRPVRFEYEHAQGDEVRTLAVTVGYIGPAAPDVPMCSYVVEDVTEERLMQRTLRATAQRFGVLIQNLQAGVLVEDEHGDVLLANEYFCTLFGIDAPPEALVGVNCADAARQARGLFRDPDAFERRIEETLQAQEIVLAEELELADGRIFARDFVPMTADGVSEGRLWLYHDVTERKRREAELLRIRSAVENASDGIAVTDETGRLVYHNPALQGLVGAASEAMWRDAAVGTAHADPDVFAEVAAAVRDGRAWQGEVILEHTRGRPVPVLLRADAIRDGEGRVLGYIGIHTDVSEQRAAEEALRRSEERFRKLVQNASDVVAILDTDGTIRYKSDSVGRILGVTPARLQGRSAFDFIHPEDRARVRDELARLAGRPGASLRTVYRWRHADGRWLWLEAVGVNLFHDDVIGGILVNSRDVTARMEASRALEKSERQYRSVVEHVRDVVFQLDAEGRVTFLNPAWTHVTGYAADETLGRPFLDFVHPDDARRDRARFRRLVRSADAATRHEVRLRTRSQGTRWVDVYVSLLQDEEGRTTGVTGMLHDVTERREALEALEHALERERELVTLKSRFVSMASHELRTPLTVIKSSSELLHAFGESWDAERRQLLHGRVLHHVEVMSELIDDVLLLGRADTERLPCEPETLDLCAYCDDLVREFVVGAGAQHDVRAHLPEAPVVLDADPKLLRHVLANLLSNAVKYAPPGTPVDLRLRVAGEEVEVVVEDRGIGIPEADLARLFEPFHRAGNVESRAGTGLGLAIAKRAADVHGGRITVESAEGAGTTFTVRLPVRRRVHAAGDVAA